MLGIPYSTGIEGAEENGPRTGRRPETGSMRPESHVSWDVSQFPFGLQDRERDRGLSILIEGQAVRFSFTEGSRRTSPPPPKWPSLLPALLDPRAYLSP
jgi:hypothetical protein